MKSIVVIGSLNVDVLQKIDRLPQQGETLSIEGKSTNFGGKGANQAVAAARQGAIVSFIGAVGSDSEGQTFIQLLEQEGINTRFIQSKKGPTGTAYIMLERDGHNTILVHGGANAELTIEDVNQAKDGCRSTRSPPSRDSTGIRTRQRIRRHDHPQSSPCHPAN